MRDASDTSTSAGDDNLVTPGTIDPELNMPAVTELESDEGIDTSPKATKPAAPRTRSWNRRLFEWVAVVILAVLAAAGLRSFAVQAFFVPSGSMLPTLQIGDRIVVVKFGYSVKRGDIIVFKRPPADVGTQDADLVKRVIKPAFDEFKAAFKEPWLPTLTGLCAESAENITTTKIPPGHYFVMGDCRGDSADSRMWGTLNGSLILGKVVVIVWRFGHPYLHFF